MPCSHPHHRLSSSRVFSLLRKSHAPEGGWNAANYHGVHAERLVQDFIKVHKTAQARGIRSLTEYLKAKFKELVNIVIQEVTERKIRLGQTKGLATVAKALEFTVNPAGDSNLWMEAIAGAMRDYDKEVIVEMLPRMQSVASEVFGKTTVLLGGEVGKDAANIVHAEMKDLAKLVTRINETTRNQMATIIREGIEAGDSVSGVAQRLRDALPQKLWPRIPTIARTEMGRAADKGSALAMMKSGVVKTVMVIGCKAIEPGIPTYHGVPTCNIEHVPVEDAALLQFHINHTGTIVPESFFDDDRAPASLPPLDSPADELKLARGAEGSLSSRPIEFAGAEEAEFLAKELAEDNILIQPTALKAMQSGFGMSPVALRNALMEDAVPKDGYLPAKMIMTQQEKGLWSILSKICPVKPGKAEGDDGCNTLAMVYDLNEKAVGQGIHTMHETIKAKAVGKQALANHLATMDSLGIKKMSLEANIDKGGFAWARYGFVPTDPNGLAGQLLKKYTSAVFDSLPKADASHVLGLISRLTMGDAKAVWEIAALKMTGPGGMGIGDWLLRGTKWQAQLDLTDKVAYKMFKKYVTDKGVASAGVALPPKILPAMVPKPLSAPVVSAAPISMSGVQFPTIAELKDTGTRIGGTTGARLMVDSKGKRWVLKDGRGAVGTITEEVHADNAYRAMGVNVPNSILMTEGGVTVKISEFMEGGVTLNDYALSASKGDIAAMYAKIRKGFAADALLGNWDVIGMDADNILIVKGVPYRIDNGGSLRYRAQGSLKGAAWNEHPVELWTMRGERFSSGAAAQAKKVFGEIGDKAELTIYDLARQIDAIDRKALLESLPEELRDTVGKRLTSLKSIARKAKDYEKDDWNHGNTDRVTFGIMELREAGISKKLEKTLDFAKSRGVRRASWEMTDDAGKSFGGLRDKGGAGQEFWDLLRKKHGPEGVDVLRAWHNAQAGGSWSPESVGLKHWLTNQRHAIAGKVERYWGRGNITTEMAENRWKDMCKVAGISTDEAGKVFSFYHAFVQEQLGVIDLPNNDRARRVVRLLRTEEASTLSAAKISVGDKNRPLRRGKNESSSLVHPTTPAGNELTVQVVPHTRVTGSYLGGNQSGGSSFLGDEENEFTFIPDKIPVSYLGTVRYDDTKWDGDFGREATDWGLSLDHLAHLND